MRIVKSYPGAEDIINTLQKYKSESAGNVFFEVSSDTSDIENSIVLRKDNEFPEGYGLIVISSKTDRRILGRKDFIIFGLTEYPVDELNQIDVDKARIFTMKKITELGIDEAADLVMESAMRFPKLCISINLDCLDRAFYAGGTIGGMTTRELISILQRLRLMKNLKTAEIVGDDKEISAKLTKELA